MDNPKSSPLKDFPLGIDEEIEQQYTLHSNLLQQFTAISSIDKAWIFKSHTDSSQGMMFSVSQPNLLANNKRKLILSSTVTKRSNSSVTLQWAPFPVEVYGVSAMVPSPSGSKLLIVRNTESDGPSRFKIWSNSYLEREFHVPQSKHGFVYTDGWSLIVFRGKILEVLKKWPEKTIQVIVVTDGERILGLGVLGCQESRGPDEIIVEIKGTSSEVQTAQQLIQEFIANHNETIASSYGRFAASRIHNLVTHGGHMSMFGADGEVLVAGLLHTHSRRWTPHSDLFKPSLILSYYVRNDIPEFAADHFLSNLIQDTTTSYRSFGLGTYVEALVRKHDTEFNVIVTQTSGLHHPTESIHIFHVGKMRIKLCKGKTTIAKEYYSSSMQLCGVRGGGKAAAQAGWKLWPFAHLITYGVIPVEQRLLWVDMIELIWVTILSTGYGTLDELLEVITWAQLGIHDKPVGLVDVDGYFNSLLSFINKVVEEGFISPNARHIIVSAPTAKELVKKLEEYVPCHEGVASKLS